MGSAVSANKSRRTATHDRRLRKDTCLDNQPLRTQSQNGSSMSRSTNTGTASRPFLSIPPTTQRQARLSYYHLPSTSRTSTVDIFRKLRTPRSPKPHRIMVKKTNKHTVCEFDTDIICDWSVKSSRALPPSQYTIDYV